MKNLFFITSVFFLTLNSLLAQDNSDKKTYNLQFNFGIGNTYHFNAPVILYPKVFCIEGCTPTDQKSRLSKNFGISLLRKRKNKNQIKLGLGYSEFRFLEKGLMSAGGPQNLPYEGKEIFKYVNIQLGYRIFIKEQTSNSFFIENNLLSELLINDDNRYSMKNIAFAYKISPGVQHKISDNLNILANAYFKTAITKYNNKSLGRNYYPIDYGLELGISFDL